MTRPAFEHPEDPITGTMPDDWLPEQKAIAGEAMRVLRKHYPGWKWGIQWIEIVGRPTGLGGMLINITDIPTDKSYMLHYDDIDRDRMSSVMRAGGEYLEAHGLSRTKWRHDEVHGLARTAAGLLVPDYAAFPDHQPGRQQAKKDFEKAFPQNKKPT